MVRLSAQLSPPSQYSLDTDLYPGCICLNTASSAEGSLVLQPSRLAARIERVVFAAHFGAPRAAEGSVGPVGLSLTDINRTEPGERSGGQDGCP